MQQLAVFYLQRLQQLYVDEKDYWQEKVQRLFDVDNLYFHPNHRSASALFVMVNVNILIICKIFYIDLSQSQIYNVIDQL